MTKSEMAKTVHRLVNANVSASIQRHIEAEVALSAAQTGYDLWHKDENNGIGMDRCPYNVERARDQVVTAKLARQNWEAVMNYTVETFIGGDDA